MDGATGQLGVEEVTYSWDPETNTLTASSERGDIFTVEVDPATGAYTLTLLQNVLHEPGQGENDAVVDLTYTVTDSNGTSVNGTFNITIDDDTPVLLGDSGEDYEGSDGQDFFVTSYEGIPGPGEGGNTLVNGLGGERGFGENVMFTNDDQSTGKIDVSSIFPGGMKLFGQTYDGFYINNNGNITFNAPMGTYTPFAITGDTSNPMIAPFFADVDTRGATGNVSDGGTSTGANRVWWDFDEQNGVITITWDDVGYFGSHSDLVNAFQLRIFNNGDGNFSFEFRYENVDWTTGDASGGSGGLGGTVVRAGWTAGDGVNYYELPQSGNQAAMLALETTSNPTTAPDGNWVFNVVGGEISMGGGSDTVTVEDEKMDGGIDEDDGGVASVTGTIVDNVAWGSDGFGEATTFSVGEDTFDANSTVYWDQEGLFLGRVEVQPTDAAASLVVNSDGTYTFTLLDNMLISGEDEQTDVLATVSITGVDGDGDPVTVNVKLQVTDDVPVAVAATAEVNEPISGEDTEVSGTYNITIVLDTSGSMDGANKIGLAKAAINNLLAEYGGPGGANAANVHVLIVGFDAATENSGWLSLAQAQAYVSDPSHLQAGGFTNYELALETTMTAFDNGTPDADTNVLYFLSDGQPTAGGAGGGHHLSSGDIAAWEAWLAGHDMDAYAVGIGTTNAADQDLLAVAYSEDAGGAANTPLIVDDPADLNATLLSIVVPGPEVLDTVTGDVFSPADGGADGAMVTAIGYTGADGYPASAVVPETGSVTVATALGELTISADGSYSYTATTGVGEDTDDVFTYTITDGDGDTSQSTLTITVDSVPEAYDVSDTVQVSQITVNTSNYPQISDWVKITVAVPDYPDIIETATLNENTNEAGSGTAFGITSNVDGGSDGRFNEINYIGEDKSEVMSFELQNDAGEAAEGMIATRATVDINVFYKGETGVGNEVGSYELYLNGASVQGPTTFTANSTSGNFQLVIDGPEGGFDEIRFAALPGTADSSGGDSSDYNVKQVTFNLVTVSEGNLLTDSTPDGTFGGDLTGAHILSIAGVDGGTADSDSTNGLTATGKYGGTLTVDPNTGDYIYTAPDVLPANDVTEKFTFTLIDGDGDTTSAQLSILIDVPDDNIPS
jgi:VCBS repeat-containing protein